MKSVTSFLCCLYFPHFSSHCLFSCRSVILCISEVLEWLWSWSLSDTEQGRCWVAPKSSSCLMTKPFFSTPINASFARGFNIFLLTSCLFFSLFFLEIGCINATLHALGKTLLQFAHFNLKSFAHSMQSSLADNTWGCTEMNDAKDRSVLLDGGRGTGYARAWDVPLLLEGAAKSTKQTNQRKYSLPFHLRLPRAQEQKWVNDRKAFRLIQGKNDRPFKCDYQGSDLEASGTEAWSKLSLWYISTETFTLTDYNEYKVDISRDKKLHEQRIAFNSSFCPWKFSQEQKALVWLLQRAAQVEVSLEVRSISLPWKIVKHLWVMYDYFCTSVEVQRGHYIKLVQQCGARFSPGMGRAGSAKPSGEAPGRSHLTLLRVIRAFNSFRTPIF